MKKFAFLLAIVAVFAMNAVTLAAPGDLRQALAVKTTGTSTNQNNGEISATGATKVYHYGTLATGDTYQINANFNCTAGDNIKNDDKIGGFNGATFVPITGVTLTNATPVDSDGNFSAVPNNATSITGIAVYEGTSDPTVADSAGATLTITPVAIAFENNADKLTALKVGAAATGTVTVKPVGLDSLEFGTDLVATISPTTGGPEVTTVSKNGVTLSGSPTTAGTYTVSLKTAATEDTLTVKETSTGDDVNVKVATDALHGVEVASFDINVVNYIVDPASADWDGNASSPASVKFTVKDLTAAKISKIEVKASGVGPEVLDKDSYTATTNGSDVEVELKLEYLEGLSKNDYTFTITGDSSKTVDFVLSVTPKAEKSYVATPASADWDGNKSAAGVKFKVDMPHSDFNAIGVEVPNDKDVRELGKDYYTVTPTVVGGIEVELKPDYLSKLTVSGDYVYHVGDKKGLAALFTLTVTPKKDTDVEATGKDLTASKDLLPEAIRDKVEFGLSQVALNKGAIEALFDAKAAASFDADGKFSTSAARSLIGGSEELRPLTTVQVEVTAKGNIAPLTFKIEPSWFVSSDIEEIDWTQAKIYKIYNDGDKVTSVQLAPAPTMGDVADGRFQIFRTGSTRFAGKLRHGAKTQYDLVVYVADDGKYDLANDTPKSIVDPIVPAQATQSSGGGSSGCNTGAGLAAIAVIASLMRKRK